MVVFQNKKKKLGIFRIVVITIIVISGYKSFSLFIKSRLELIEARRLIADLFIGSWITEKCCDQKKIELAIEQSISNQYKVIKYAIRRKVMNRYFHDNIYYFVTKQGLVLDKEKRLVFDNYHEEYEESFGWTGDQSLLILTEDWLYNKWDDKRENWISWGACSSEESVK